MTGEEFIFLSKHASGSGRSIATEKKYVPVQVHGHGKRQEICYS